MYGDQDRFLPLWAWRLGYKVKEVKVKQLKLITDKNFIRYKVICKEPWIDLLIFLNKVY